MRALLLEGLPDEFVWDVPSARRLLQVEWLLPGAHVAIVANSDPAAQCLLARVAGLTFRDTISIVEAARLSWVLLFRMPLEGTLVETALKYGTGFLNLDSIRTRLSVKQASKLSRPPRTPNAVYGGGKGTNLTAFEGSVRGRHPTNAILVHSPACTLLACDPSCVVLNVQSRQSLLGEELHLTADSYEEAVELVRTMIGAAQ